MKVKLLCLWMISITGILYITSCNPDDPADKPDADEREKFVGTWTCVEQATQLTYTVVISKSTTNQNQILLKNFHHFGDNEYATGIVSGFSLTLPDQWLCNNEWNVKGTGLMGSNRNSITLNYTVTGGANSETIQAIYTKQ